LHGTFCEDGTLQGLLELAMVPYVGADVLGSAVGMDKDVAKRLLHEAGISVVPSLTVNFQQWRNKQKSIMESAIDKLGLPLFVKPVCTGSSVGVKKVKEKTLFPEAVDYALQFDTRVIIEKAIDCREIECAVLGNENPAASVLGEIIPSHEFYSYEAKYIDPQGAVPKIPAQIEPALAAAIRKMAVTGYLALGCSSMARVDFFLDKKTSKFYLNEINTLPGFTSISMYPKLWEATGLQYSDLLETLIELAQDRHKRKMAIKTELN
jgi:D-alanine-D-alanine ligase